MGKQLKDAEKESLIEFFNLLKKIEQADSEEEKNRLLDEAIKKAKVDIEKFAPQPTGIPWDFSKEKQMEIFTEEGRIKLIPFKDSDKDSYIRIHRQYVSSIYDYDYEEYRNVAFSQIMGEEGFYCGIYLMDTEDMIGYVGLKDTTKNLWELVIEIDSDYRFHGIGGESIKLFIAKVSEITKKDQFNAFVEYDNAASRRMFEKIGARLIGIANNLFPSLAAASDYEEKHISEITDDMRALANELEVEPRQLLSHVLEYNVRVQ